MLYFCWYCPSFILAIAGPWLCVLGAVYANRAIMQPLTEYLLLGGDVFSDDRLRSVSRLFAALRTSISKLRKYYNSLSNGVGIAPMAFRSSETFKGGHSHTSSGLQKTMKTNSYTK